MADPRDCCVCGKRVRSADDRKAVPEAIHDRAAALKLLAMPQQTVAHAACLRQMFTCCILAEGYLLFGCRELTAEIITKPCKPTCVARLCVDVVEVCQPSAVSTGRLPCIGQLS